MDVSQLALAAFHRRYVKPAPGRALVAGSRCYDGKKDRRALYAEAIGVDMLAGPGVDVVHDLEKPLPAEMGQFSHVDCCSVLEHVRNPFKFARSLEAAMQPSATILLVVPWVWRIHAYPNDYWRFTPAAVRVLFRHVKWSPPLYLVHDRVTKSVPHLEVDGLRAIARAELAMTGVRRCSGTS